MNDLFLICGIVFLAGLNFTQLWISIRRKENEINNRENERNHGDSRN